MAAILRSTAGKSVTAYAAEVAGFFANARHPTLGRPYATTVYRPMVELLRFLEEREFTCYIVSGGDRDFMRPVTAEYYGIPPERVVGSAVALTWSDDDGGGDVVYGPSFSFLDDGPEKPVRIWSRVGRRPILAAGNSNGDVPMLSFATGGRDGLGLLIHHDDDTGRGDVPYESGADKALADAPSRGWTVVSVKDDWQTVFA